MRVLLTGASGLIGSALQARLRASGHDIVRLVRSEPRSPEDVRWDPKGASVDVARLGRIDAVVHLAGAPIAGRRWTADYKRELRDSRVLGTATLSRALTVLEPRPAVLLSGSAIGWYGDSGDSELDESTPAGSGFLPELVRDWEAATGPAELAGIRVAHLRTGLVLSGRGGLLTDGAPLPGGGHLGLNTVYRLGLGARLGSGRQWMSWISLRDEIGAIEFLLADPRAAQVSGPVNLTGPEPVRNTEFSAALAGALHRPNLLWAPEPALRLVLGEFADDVLASQRVLPKALLAAGYQFADTDLAEVLRRELTASAPAQG